MAGASYPVDHALVVQQIKVGMNIEAERATRVAALMGTNPASAFVIEEFGGTKRGANLRLTFLPMRHGDDLTVKARGAVVVGNEDDQTEKTDNLDLDYLILSTRAAENLVADQGNVDFDILESRQVSMVREASEIIETSVMNQLAGYTVVNGLTGANVHPYGKSGCNPCREPDTAHHFFAGGLSTEAAVAADSTAVLTNRLVEQSMRKLRSLDHVDWPVAPASTPFGEVYMGLGNGEALEQVKENNTDSDVYDLSKAILQGGGDPETSTLIAGEGFKLNRIVYLETDFAPFGTNGGTADAESTSVTKRANVKRFCLFGARALHIIYGEGFVDGLHLGYAEHQVMRRLSMMIDTVWGVRVVRVDTQRWGSCVISHYNSV